ncbi:MAG: signal peptidase I, partial [Steroidobacteraceae bacterium]
MSHDAEATASTRRATATDDAAAASAETPAPDAAPQTPEILHGAARCAADIEGDGGYKVEIARAEPGPEPADGGWMAALQSLTMTVVIALFVITFLLQAFQIPSSSMENTLLTGDYVLVDKVHYGQGGWWGDVLPYSVLQRGDIIVFRYPVN